MHILGSSFRRFRSIFENASLEPAEVSLLLKVLTDNDLLFRDIKIYFKKDNETISFIFFIPTNKIYLGYSINIAQIKDNLKVKKLESKYLGTDNHPFEGYTETSVSAITNTEES